MPSLTGGSLGNTSTSSLIRSATSTASAQQDYEDKLAALEWSASAQDDAAFQTYSQHLQSRITNLSSTGSLTDASKALSLTSTLQSANRSYVSNSIQSSAINILEGNATLQDKQTAVVQFYQQALNNGDENLAQNLRQQYDSINQQIQYNQQAQQDLYTKMAAANVTTTKAYVNTLKEDLTNFSGYIKNTDPKGLDDMSASYAKNLKDSGVDIGDAKPSVFDVYNGVVNNILTALNTQITAQGVVNASDLVTEYNNIQSGSTKFDVGGQSLSYQDIQNQLAAQAAGNTIYQWVDRNGQQTLIKNQAQSYVWSKDPTTGQFYIQNTYNSNGQTDDFGQTGLVNKNKQGQFVDSSGKVIGAANKQGEIVDTKGNVIGQADQYGNVASVVPGSALDKAQESSTNLLKNAGFDVSGSGENTAIGATQQTYKLLKDAGLDPTNFNTNILMGPDGQVRFKYTDESGNTNLYGISFKNDGSLSSLYAINPMSDTIPGFAGSLTAPNLVAGANTQALKAQQLATVAKLASTPLSSVAQFNLPTTAAAPTLQAAAAPQPAPNPVQTTAPTSTVQNAQNKVQTTISGNALSQSGKSTGITLKQSAPKGIAL